MPPVLARLGRVVKVGLIAGVAIGIARTLRGRARRPDVTGEAHWQPLAEPEPAPTRERRRWVEPVNGACPASHPVKGNAGSMIFHVPGGAFYDRVAPERCYASAADAEADGFRAAKR